MAQITVHRALPQTDDRLVRRERMRSAVPVALAVSLLWGVVIAGAVLLGRMLDFGVWFLTSA